MYRVLVIDDEKMVSDVLSQALSLYGYSVDTASGGLEGLQKFEQGLYDLVITDMWMPDIDGHGVLRGIRNSERPGTPIIGMSGTPWALPDGEFDSVFSKPFDIHRLMDTVHELTVRH